MLIDKKLSIRKKQFEEAKQMINLNSDVQLDWKFLIYDDIGENIIGPLFNIEDLENLNVTSHLHLHRRRDSVPDVSAVYFVMPTNENIERICQDLVDHLYDSYYLNFISPISRSKLELIADAALSSDAAINVKKVYDQYLNFIALEDDLFILRENDKNQISYHAYNRSDASDDEITQIIDKIVDGLFSVLVTLNIVPIIRCPEKGIAVDVAQRLTRKIRETLRDSRNNLFENKDPKTGGSSLSLSLQRPLLCLLDRTFDMSTPLHHTWTYHALIHDVLNTGLNKVTVVDETGRVKSKIQTFDLNPNDKFWKEQRGNPFPKVAEAVQRELDEYKRRENEVKSPIDLNTPLGAEVGDEGMKLAESTAKLTNTMSSLQELLENKRIIGNHTTIAHAVLDEIKKRKLDNFFEIEEKVMNRNLIERATLDDMLSNPDYGEPNDKYRLFLICYICDNPILTDDEADRYVSILEELGCKRAAFEHVRSWKTMSKVNVASLQSSLQSSGGVLETAGMFSKLMSKGSQFVMEGVKNLVLNEKYLPLTKIVDGLMDSTSKANQELNYKYFDPKAQKDSDVQRKKSFQEAIVFVIGGGNYIEYQNLVDYCKSKSQGTAGAHGSRHVIYGSTDLMNASQFLKQLDQLGDCA